MGGVIKLLLFCEPFLRQGKAPAVRWADLFSRFKPFTSARACICAQSVYLVALGCSGAKALPLVYDRENASSVSWVHRRQRYYCCWGDGCRQRPSSVAHVLKVRSVGFHAEKQPDGWESQKQKKRNKRRSSSFFFARAVGLNRRDRRRSVHPRQLAGVDRGGLPKSVERPGQTAAC